MAERRRNPRRLSFVMDILHLTAGAVIVVLAVLAFLDPDGHRAFFPVIFFLAAFLSLADGIVFFRAAQRDNRKKLAGAGRFLFGLVLLALGVVSAMVIL